MPKVEETVTTSAGIDEVWAFLSDFTTTEQWDPPTVSTVRVSGDGGVGTRYQNTSRVLGHDTDIVYTVVEHEAPRLLRLRGESDSFTAEDTILLSPDGEGTVVSYTADFSFTGAAKLASPSWMPASRRSVTTPRSRWPSVWTVSRPDRPARLPTGGEAETDARRPRVGQLSRQWRGRRDRHLLARRGSGAQPAGPRRPCCRRRRRRRRRGRRGDAPSGSFRGRRGGDRPGDRAGRCAGGPVRRAGDAGVPGVGGRRSGPP